MHIMPVAVGIYLPFGLSVPILLGGLIHLAVKRGASSKARGASRIKRGVLFASGIIAGESLMGVGLAILYSMGIVGLSLAESLGDTVITLLTLGTFGFIAWLFYSQSQRKSRDEAGPE
jgi:hypothetical protein